MDFAPVYLAERLARRLGGFFAHWYVGGSRAIGNRFMFALEGADEVFAVKITLRHFFEPLYKDYSAVGRVVGVVFRTGRVAVGGVVFLSIALFFAAIYLVWLAIPVAILWYVATGKTVVALKIFGRM